MSTPRIKAFKVPDLGVKLSKNFQWVSYPLIDQLLSKFFHYKYRCFATCLLLSSKNPTYALAAAPSIADKFVISHKQYFFEFLEYSLLKL